MTTLMLVLALAAPPARPSPRPQPSPSPRAARPSPAPAPSPSPTPAPTGVAISHKDVGCVVAGEYPRFEACFTPAASVGRAQVQFRADETGPWYGVAMTP